MSLNVRKKRKIDSQGMMTEVVTEAVISDVHPRHLEVREVEAPENIELGLLRILQMEEMMKIDREVVAATVVALLKASTEMTEEDTDK